MPSASAERVKAIAAPYCLSSEPQQNNTIVSSVQREAPAARAG